MEDIAVTEREFVPVIEGLEALTAGSEKWTAKAVDDKRILLISDDAKGGLTGETTGMASCPTGVFKDFLLGLHHAGWSGVVSVDTGYGIKKIYLARGDLVFAASNIMDDRLGEVIYREAKISLDELTNSAAQVTKVRKFGQVLISSGIFTNVELWQALKLQVKQIIRSVFMVDRVFFEMQAGSGLAPTEVIFQESVAELVGECFSYGSAFRSFLGKLRAESQAVLQLSQADKERFVAGTFVGDLVALIEAQGAVQELLNASKLIDTYTVAALLNLVNQGLCKIIPDVDDGLRPPPFMAPLKAKFDAYSYVLQAVRKAFAEGEREFPAADVRVFAASLNPESFPSLFLDTEANLSRDCIAGIISQCVANSSRVGYFVIRMESLIQFLLQVAGDNLAFQTASKIRQDYRAVTT